MDAARAFSEDGAKLVTADDGAGVLRRTMGRLDEEEGDEEGDNDEQDEDTVPARLSLGVTFRGSTEGEASIAPSTSSALPLLLSVESIPESIFCRVNGSVAQLLHAYEAVGCDLSTKKATVRSLWL